MSMETHHFSEEGLMHIINTIMHGIMSCLKINNEVTGEICKDKETDEYVWSLLRDIHTELLYHKQFNVYNQIENLLNQVKRLDDLDSEGFFPCGWREEFGLEILR